MDEYTEIESENFFKINHLTPRPAEWDSDVITNVSYEVSPHLNIIFRDGYTFLDILSDLGGISSLISVAFALIVSLFNKNRFDQFLI